MPVLNVAKLAMQATDVAYRVDFVRQDPAVVKAAKQAGHDIRVASKSTFELGREMKSSWNGSRN